jgi:hypothetical protein
MLFIQPLLAVDSVTSRKWGYKLVVILLKILSRVSEYSDGLRTVREKVISVFFTAPTLAVGSPNSQSSTLGLPHAINPAMCEADHSPPSSVEVKNGASVSPPAFTVWP